MAYLLAEIKKILTECPVEELPQTMEQFKEDTRLSVVKEIERANIRIRKYQEEWQEQMRRNREKRPAVAFMTMHGSL